MIFFPSRGTHVEFFSIALLWSSFWKASLLMGSVTFQNSTESRHPFGMARQLPFFSKRKIVIRERRFLIFMVGSSLVDTRSVFSETAKKENFNFSFLLFLGVSGVKPLIKVMASRSEAEG